jgi:hypothetical protein
MMCVNHEFTYYECPLCGVWRTTEEALTLHYEYKHQQALEDAQSHKRDAVVKFHRKRKGRTK